MQVAFVRHPHARAKMPESRVRSIPCTHILILCFLVATFVVGRQSLESRLKSTKRKATRLVLKPLTETEVDLVKRKSGIYEDVTKSAHFQDIILLTSGNYGYVDMYRNWACHARRL